MQIIISFMNSFGVISKKKKSAKFFIRPWAVKRVFSNDGMTLTLKNNTL